MAVELTFSDRVNLEADFNGDGLADIVSGAGLGGGPAVTVIDAARLGERRPGGEIAESALLLNIFAYDVAFSGGLSETAGDANGDDRPDIITAECTVGWATVKAFDDSFVDPVCFSAFDQDEHAGVSVAVHRIPAGSRLLDGSLGSVGVRLCTPPAFDPESEWSSLETVCVG